MLEERSGQDYEGKWLELKKQRVRVDYASSKGGNWLVIEVSALEFAKYRETVES